MFVICILLLQQHKFRVVLYLILQQYDIMYFLKHLYTEQLRTHCFYFYVIITELLALQYSKS